MARSPIHFTTIYYLPSLQGGDVHVPLCQRLPIGWSGAEGRDWAMTELREGVTCACCRTILVHGKRPTQFRKLRVAA